MIEVTKEKFFACIGGPENIHPRSEPDESVWEIVGTRAIVGRSQPGYLGPWNAPKRYWLAPDFLKRKDARP